MRLEQLEALALRRYQLIEEIHKEYIQSAKVLSCLGLQTKVQDLASRIIIEMDLCAKSTKEGVGSTALSQSTTRSVRLLHYLAEARPSHLPSLALCVEGVALALRELRILRMSPCQRFCEHAFALLRIVQDALDNSSSSSRNKSSKVFCANNHLDHPKRASKLHVALEEALDALSSASRKNFITTKVMPMTEDLFSSI